MKTPEEIIGSLELDPEWFALNEDRDSIEDELRKIAVNAINVDRAQREPEPRPSYKPATINALIEAWEAFGYDDVSVFIHHWEKYLAGYDFPCPKHPAGIHQVTDGSCDLCGDKNRE